MQLTNKKNPLYENEQMREKYSNGDYFADCPPSPLELCPTEVNLFTSWFSKDLSGFCPSLGKSYTLETSSYLTIF